MNAEYQRLEAEASAVEKEMQVLTSSRVPISAFDLAKLEQEISQLGRKLASLRLGMVLVRTAESQAMRAREREFIKSLAKVYHSQGTREKKIYLPGGVTVTLSVTYYHRKKTGGNASRGLFPALMLLGITGHFTPHMKDRMAKASALLGSYEEAVEMLADDGICITVNQLRDITAGMGKMLRRMTSQGSITAAGNLAGKRVVVSMDGGRVRLREPRRGKTKKGRKKFAAKWREPRLFIISIVDDEGRMSKDFAPVIDGALGSCDQLFALLQAYLKGLNVVESARVLFVADGASWIWRRIPKLVRALGLKDDQVQQLIDFWHAMEYLGKIAESKSLKGAQKSRWLKTQKKRLLRGEIGSVIEEIQTLLGSHKTKPQKTWLNYFITNGLTHRRMDYSRSRDHQTPIGSGAIESAVRRIINLRVKSNATYRLRDNAETMIRLRAWIKAGRAEELFRQITYVTPELAL